MLPRKIKGKCIIKFQRSIYMSVIRNIQIPPCSHNSCLLPLIQKGLLLASFNVFHKFVLQGRLAAVNYAYKLPLCQRKLNYSNFQGHRNIQRCQFDNPKNTRALRNQKQDLPWKAGYTLIHRAVQEAR